LSAIDSAGKLDPNRTDIHYLRGQICSASGAKKRGKKKWKRHPHRQRTPRPTPETGGKRTVPSPELLGDDQ